MFIFYSLFYNNKEESARIDDFFMQKSGILHKNKN